MTTKVSNWGNGLGLHIPKAVVQAMGLEAGDSLELSLKADGSFLVKPVKSVLTLKELIAKIDPKNLPEDVWAGMKPVGRELW